MFKVFIDLLEKGEIVGQSEALELNCKIATKPHVKAGGCFCIRGYKIEAEIFLE